MDAMEAIITRRSIRKYTSAIVPDKIVKELLNAAMMAPSAGNQQPWHFVVITERKILDKVPNIHKNAQMIKDAPLGILICGEPALEKYKGMWVQDCAAATQNLLLAAHAKGLGAVWIGIDPIMGHDKAVQELIGMPKEIIPFSLISIGYPAEEKKTPDRYKHERIHKNTW